MELAARKTACLFSGCARLGGVLGQLSEPKSSPWPTTATMPAWPFSWSTICWTSLPRPHQLGKPVLSDLKEGKVTLPLIYALESDGAAGPRMVRTVLEEKGFHSVRAEEISALVRDSGALDRTRAGLRICRPRQGLPQRPRRHRIRPRAVRRSRFHPRPRTLTAAGVMLPFKLVYHDGYDLRLGAHVFPSQKFRLVRDALLAEGVADPADFLSPSPPPMKTCLRVHTPEWVDKLRTTAQRRRTHAPGNPVLAGNRAKRSGWPPADRFSPAAAPSRTDSASISAADFTTLFPVTAKASA